jgi:hypothetical protein
MKKIILVLLLLSISFTFSSGQVAKGINNNIDNYLESSDPLVEITQKDFFRSLSFRRGRFELFLCYR